MFSITMNFFALFVTVSVLKLSLADFSLDDKGGKHGLESKFPENDRNLIDNLSENDRNLIDNLSEKSQKKLSKRSIVDHYEDSHCVESFETSDKTIIRTIESKTNGAVFLNNTDVDTYERCLRFCCETTMCTVAVWDQQNGGCYLFDCGPSTPEEFKCRFTGNEAFTSGALLINRHAFEMSRWDHQSKHENTLQDLVGEGGRVRGGGDVVQPQTAGSQFSSMRGDQDGGNAQQACGQYEFTCQSGDCIAVYDVCNGIAQCTDGSDEDPSVCPTTTVKPVQPIKTRVTPFVSPAVVTPPARPANIEQWGREGERYQAGGGQQQQPVPQLVPQQQQQIPTSPFQHRNPAIQVPPFQQQQQQLGPRYGLDYNNYGYQQQPGYFPGSNGGYRPDNGYYIPPGQAPQQQYPLVDNRYPVQSFPNVPVQQQQPQQFPNNPPATTLAPPLKSGTKSSATNPSSSSKASSMKTTQKTTQNPDEVLKMSILSNLSDEDFVMETPSAALFTLIFGSLFSGVLCVLLICRCRSLRKSRSRKRNLASDADGDYLVNGMYL